MNKEISISSRYQQRARGRRGQHVPFIRLSGKWLDAIGFNEGARVRVSGEVGKLTLIISYRKSRKERVAG